MFELQKFREQMGIEDHEYVLLHNLKTRVLDLAVEQMGVEDHEYVLAPYCTPWELGCWIWQLSRLISIQHTDIQVSYA